MPLAYHIVDVFTDERFAGNPLAVVLDADGLDTRACQAIAREFNLSETVFVMEPRDPVNTARARIFTPARELPFAGHPTVGTAALLALVRAPEMIVRQDLAIVLEEEVGEVQCTVRRVKGRVRASFELPQAPARVGEAPARAELARALSLDIADVGVDAHVPSVFSAGVPFVLVPLKSLDAVARAAPDLAEWAQCFKPPLPPSVFVYAQGGKTEGAAFHARMFAPAFGIHEDPATGSALAAFAGATTLFDGYADGDHTLVVEQGFEMGRPSLMTLGLEIERGRLVSASIGGGVVQVAQGTLL